MGRRLRLKRINPNVKIASLSSNYNMKDQVSQMKDFISSGVDLIVLGAANSKAIASSVKQAKARGIVVVAVDVGAEGGVDATVMSDNKQAGEQAAQYIVDKLHGKGQVVIVNGQPVTAVQDRVAGAFRFSRNIQISKFCPRTRMPKGPNWVVSG